MYQRGDEAQQIPITAGEYLHQHTAAEGGEDHTHVLHGGIRQHALDIRFHLRVQHAQEGRKRAQHHHQHAPPIAPGRQKVEHKATEAIERDFQHHAAHQCRNMARRGRMRVRQPHVQRHKTCLQREADKSGSEDGMLPYAAQAILCQRSEGKIIASGAEQQKGDHNRRRADRGHHQILIGGIPGRTLLRFMVDQQEGSHRHNFPE